MSEEIPPRMQCPVCYNVLHPPIHVCKNKHGVCGDCYDKMKLARQHSCPLCRAEFDPQSLTRILMERFYNVMRVKCKYYHYGCKKVLCGGCMKMHMRHCMFETNRCPMRENLKCLWEGPANLLSAHCSQHLEM